MPDTFARVLGEVEDIDGRALGVGVDYALYLLSVQLAMQRRGATLAEAYRRSLDFTGRVVALVGLTLVLVAALAAQDGRDVLIEPINTRSVPGFHLNRQDDAHRIVQAVGASNVKVQMDLFHCQIVEGDLSANIAKHLPTGRVGHFQIAEVPDRHEPGTGEVNWPHIFKTIDRVAAEFPRNGRRSCAHAEHGFAMTRLPALAIGWRPLGARAPSLFETLGQRCRETANA